MSTHFIIITPTHNRRQLVTRTIDSVVAQDYANWTLIVVNDGSTDGTEAELQRYREQDNIIVINLTPNQGCNFARNTALDHVETQGLHGYLTLLDDDDYLTPGSLADMDRVISAHPEWKWLVANCVYPDGRRVSRIAHYGKLSYLFDNMYGKRLQGDLSHFIHSDIVKGIRFTTQIRNGEEWYFFAMLASRSEIHAVDRDTKVVEYLEDGLSRTKINAHRRLEVAQLKVDRLQSLVPAKLLCQQKIRLGRELIRAGNPTQGIRILNSCLAISPFNPRLYKYLLEGYARKYLNR
jgi:glycosyltransferase involved in cell wall biosynthesis